MSSTDTLSVKSMRWVARLLSIAWACWALFWTWFVSGSLYGEGRFSLAVFIIILIVAVLMFMGAAIIASVLGKEAFGGVVLLADGLLIIASFVIVCFLVEKCAPLLVIIGAFFTTVLPPLVAGSLFLACHRKSKK